MSQSERMKQSLLANRMAKADPPPKPVKQVVAPMPPPPKVKKPETPKPVVTPKVKGPAQTPKKVRDPDWHHSGHRSDKQRLPDGSRFDVRYDASKVLWIGELTFPFKELMVKLAGESNAVFRLLRELDAQYREWKRVHNPTAEGPAPATVTGN